MSVGLFPKSFTVRSFRASQVDIHFIESPREGKPPLLLLHGFPQTHVMWHQVAPQLAESFHVIAPDLRGYGDSGKPLSTEDHAPYSKRAMAQDAVELMEHLGYRNFNVAAHDRGARVTHRLCLDHPERVLRACVMDIVPTHFVLKHTDRALATAYYHWFFFQQPAPFPERLIGADPEFFLKHSLNSWSQGNLAALDARAVAEYVRCYSRSETIHAACEDYRAAATIDFEHDEADLDKRVQCPLLVLWGGRGFVAQNYDVLGIWRNACAREPVGSALDCGHFLPEEKPDETVRSLESFFTCGPSPRSPG